ncbi:unnamed protein product [Didymodactylos carnosus]|uniref:Uncharacterized protein n=1 Tax=Didymodactylos carnosus TaxID=1234261 RepID=A0A815HCZ0_9BILA|nr:unnamed protein product [Didymodactylos carnosus]CAF4223713.1 unnamed protein product [Didymodactylos carnosus]
MANTISLIIFSLLFNSLLSLNLKNNVNTVVNNDREKSLLKLQKIKCQQPYVTLNVYSGRENPQWSINLNQMRRVKIIINQTRYNLGKNNKIIKRVLGYQGFTVHCHPLKKVRLNEDIMLVNGVPKIEHYLLSTGRRYLKQSIRNHVRKHLGEVTMIQQPPGNNQSKDDNDNNNNNNNNNNAPSNTVCSRVPIVGPDVVPLYNPYSDNYGCFVRMIDYNNCYAYGNRNMFTKCYIRPAK